MSGEEHTHRPYDDLVEPMFAGLRAADATPGELGESGDSGDGPEPSPSRAARAAPSVPGWWLIGSALAMLAAIYYLID